jgi:hypothetical protein
MRFTKKTTHISDPTYLYMIRCQNYIKIGISSQPEVRISALQIGCPFKLEMVGYFLPRNAWVIEHAAHKILTESGRHTHGEWFEMMDEEEIQNLFSILRTKFCS